MDDIPRQQYHDATEIVGSKVFGALKASPKAFRLFNEIGDIVFRQKALEAAWRCTIAGSAAERRYSLELLAAKYSKHPADTDVADDYAVAMIDAYNAGVLPQGVCEIVLKQLGHDSFESWRQAVSTANSDAPSNRPLHSQPQRLGNALGKLARVRADIRRYLPVVSPPEPGS